MKRRVWELTTIASAMHFLVDGLCVCTLYQLSTPLRMDYLLGLFVTYNVLAFLTQPLTGWLADRQRLRHVLVLAAVMMLILAVILLSLTTLLSADSHSWQLPLVIASLLGIGNSLFHVWGGKETAVKTGNDIRALGVFVATGAFGLSVGVVFSSWALTVILLLLLCLLALLYISMDKAGESKPCQSPTMTKKISVAGVAAGVSLIMLFVMFRSFVGELFSGNIHRTAFIILVIGATAMLGKIAGGWLAKGLGSIRAFVVELLLTFSCYCCMSFHVGFAFAGLFMVNCTMPITLYWANILLPGKEGLSFGLLAASLIPGYLLALI